MRPIFRTAPILAAFLLLCPIIKSQTAQPNHKGCTIDTSEPTAIDIAMGRGENKKAADLLTAAIAKDPEDSKDRYQEISLLLYQDKLVDAQKKADAWTQTDPKDAYAILSEASIRFKEGDWLESYALTLKAAGINPCIPYAYTKLADFERVSGYRATSHKHLALAHQLAPNDPMIRLEWIYSLGQVDQLSEIKNYLADSKLIAEKDRKKAITSFDKEAGRVENQCELASSSGPAVIPMSPVYDTSVGIKTWGLKIFFNGKERTLQIDTGASGFTLVQSTGAMLGLPKIEKSRIGGLGDEGSGGSILTKAASVRVGGLEFKNCEVNILDHTGIIGSGGALPGERLDETDGLVGTDIFDRYLVTVDYIKHEIRLDPLPQPKAGAKSDIKLDALGGRTDVDWMDIDRVIDPSMQTWTKIYRRGHMLIMPTRITDSKGIGSNHLFLVDTGADSNLIDADVAKQITNTSENTLISMGGLSGKTDKVFEAGKFTLDFAGLRLPVTTMDAIDLSSFNGVTGFLGYPTLIQLIMHIDYRDNLMTFEAPQGKKRK